MFLSKSVTKIRKTHLKVLLTFDHRRNNYEAELGSNILIWKHILPSIKHLLAYTKHINSSNRYS